MLDFHPTPRAENPTSLQGRLRTTAAPCDRTANSRFSRHDARPSGSNSRHALLQEGRSVGPVQGGRGSAGAQTRGDRTGGPDPLAQGKLGDRVGVRATNLPHPPLWAPPARFIRKRLECRIAVACQSIITAVCNQVFSGRIGRALRICQSARTPPLPCPVRITGIPFRNVSGSACGHAKLS